MPEAPDPWLINYFEPPTPHVDAPAPRARAPKPIPEIEALFRVQRNALKVLNDLDELQAHLKGEKDLHLLKIARRLRHDAEDTYRVINTYLRHNTQGVM